MIEIKYYGGNTLTIKADKQELIINPKRISFGLDNLKVKNLIEIITESKYYVEDEKLLIDSAGEYEVDNFIVRGYATKNYGDFDDKLDQTFYVVEVNDFKIAIIGNISAKLSEDQIENIGTVDILILPTGGGGYTLYGKESAKIISEIEPKIVIPTHYADSGLSYEVNQDDLSELCKELAVEPIQKDNLKLKKVSDLPEKLELLELKRN